SRRAEEARSQVVPPNAPAQARPQHGQPAPPLPTKRLVVSSPKPSVLAPSLPPVADVDGTPGLVPADPAPQKPDFFGFAATTPTNRQRTSVGPLIFGRVILRGTPPPEKTLPLRSEERRVGKGCSA